MHRVARAATTIGLTIGLLAGSAIAQDNPARAPDSPPSPVSGNPAASNFSLGTGWLGRTLGLKDDWGVTLGGLWLADTNVVAAGGAQPGGWTSNSALLLGLTIDAEKLVDWRGGSFGFQFLQVNVADTNGEAGSVQGYNGIGGLPPFNRTEIFEAWYRQEMRKDVLSMRIGRSVPTNDFGNVLRPVTLADSAQNIPAVSGLLFVPVFKNASMIGAMPGYYNPGDGVTVNFTPTRSFYVNAGVYDGNLARGVQTGLAPPQFNGYFFNIAEIGTNWLLGPGQHPGQFGAGLWRQTGVLSAGGVTQDGTGGFYLFGSQRVAFGLNPAVEKSSISVFYQFGVNESRTLPINQYYSAGITGFSLVGNRPSDSMGIGAAFSRLNPVLFARPSELMLQAYYQAHLFAATFLQPTVSYIPSPGASPTLPGALALTMRLTVLF